MRFFTALILLLITLPMPLYGEELLFDGVMDKKGRRMDDSKYDLIRELEAREERGIQLYRAEKYEAAYELLSDTARQGFKRSQHTLALMHVNGQSVERNVLVGIALLGLAAESGDRKLKKEYSGALKKIPKKYQSLVEEQTNYYIQRYGMKVQGVACSKVKRTNSNMKTMQCLKQPGEYEDIAWTP